MRHLYPLKQFSSPPGNILCLPPGCAAVRSCPFSPLLGSLSCRPLLGTGPCPHLIISLPTVGRQDGLPDNLSAPPLFFHHLLLPPSQFNHPSPFQGYGSLPRLLTGPADPAPFMPALPGLCCHVIFQGRIGSLLWWSLERSSHSVVPTQGRSCFTEPPNLSGPRLHLGPPMPAKQRSQC